jgi:predicted Zn-dependent protease with MMP-like domain
MAKSRPKRWYESLASAQSAIEAVRVAMGEVESAFSELQELQQEYQDWYDNLPEGLAQSTTADLLEQITNLELEFSDSLSLEELEQIIGEAEGVELPRGFGRD